MLCSKDRDFVQHRNIFHTFNGIYQLWNISKITPTLVGDDPALQLEATTKLGSL